MVEYNNKTVTFTGYFYELNEDEEYEENEVIEQSVEAGTMLSTGDDITIYAPKIVNEYPDFTDGTWTVDDVKKFCEEYELNVTFKYK